MDDLLALDACRPPESTNIHPELRVVSTPMVREAWEQALQSFPNCAFVDYITHGIRDGFRVGFDYRLKLQSRTKNMRSAKKNTAVVKGYIEEEKSAGRLLPVQSKHLLPKCQISPFGVIPKRYQPGKWRLIVDLSSPDRASVNDGIDARLCSLEYPSVHDAARLGRVLGNAMLAKLDLKSAYRIVPIHP